MSLLIHLMCWLKVLLINLTEFNHIYSQFTTYNTAIVSCSFLSQNITFLISVFYFRFLVFICKICQICIPVCPVVPLVAVLFSMFMNHSESLQNNVVDESDRLSCDSSLSISCGKCILLNVFICVKTNMNENKPFGELIF